MKRFAKGAQRRERIIESARDVLLQNGYAQFTLRNVADHVGVNVGLVHYYFESKQSLIQALVEHVVEEYQTIQSGVCETTADPVDRFKTVMDLAVLEAKEPRTRRLFIHLWALMEAEDSQVGSGLLSATYAREQAQFMRLLEPVGLPVSQAELGVRVALLTAITDGLMLMHESSFEGGAQFEDIRNAVKVLVGRFATDPTLLREEPVEEAAVPRRRTPRRAGA